VHVGGLRLRGRDSAAIASVAISVRVMLMGGVLLMAVMDGNRQSVTATFTPAAYSAPALC
jgi:hypothetical protein